MEEDKSTSASDLISNRTSKDHRAFEEMDWDLHFDRVFASDDKVQPIINNVFRWKGEAKEVLLSGSFDNWSSQLPLVKTIVCITAKHPFLLLHLFFPSTPLSFFPFSPPSFFPPFHFLSSPYFLPFTPAFIFPPSLLHSNLLSPTPPFCHRESEFYTIKPLIQGCHQYKFLVDGEWKVHDLETTNKLQGEEVNVVTVRGADNDVFVSLAKDDVRTANLSKLHFKTGWTQELPPRGLGYGFLRSGPNLLPPQLSNTVLNDEVQAKCDPTILPQPTHVVLNHLYTLSIKDGVLVMASTYRFRKKYITTLIYKPI